MDTTPNSRNRARRRAWATGLALALAASVGLWVFMDRQERQRAIQAAIGLTAEVQRGPLKISLVESGTIMNRERIIVRSEVEGSRNIIQLVPEGVTVQADDLLVELDASSLQDQRLEQDARVKSSEASAIQSSENVAVTSNQATSDVAQAELDLRFAGLALEQYEQGEYPQQLQQAEASITIANEELKRARDSLEWSRTLETDGYITRSELEADELALKRRELDLELAISKRDLLTRFTNVQSMERLKSDIVQAERALERTQRKAKADIIRAEADLQAKEFDLWYQRNRLQRLQDQIAKCKITAPSAGMVIYATSVQSQRWRRVDPLEPGQSVRERQELIYLPATGSMMVEVNIQEANLPKLRNDMPARITLDSGSNRTFSGYLHKIGILPSSAGMALNPDLKLYTCEVYIDENATGLRQGMSCTVELMVENHDDALFVPLQALVRKNGAPTVYLAGPRGPDPRAVQVGLDNGRMVHILDGLSQGERVLLAPPLDPTERRDQSTARAEALDVAGAQPPAAPTPEVAPLGEPPRRDEQRGQRGQERGGMGRSRPSGDAPTP